MTEARRVFISSKRDDVWHRLEGDAYERWSFNAISDDGREVVCVSFYDHCPMSPRYYLSGLRRVPLVELTFSVGGELVARAMCEYGDGAFVENGDGYGIGTNRFYSESANYGTGYIIELDLPMSGGRRVNAKLEWLAVEENRYDIDVPTGDVLNVVTPRADVSGRITVSGRKSQVYHIRGTGCHAHEVIRGGAMEEFTQFSGCVHFSDATAFFRTSHDSSMFLVQGDSVREIELSLDSIRWQRNRYGMRYPREMSYASEHGIRLCVRPTATVVSVVTSVRSRSEFELTLPDGRTRQANGITFFASPRRMRHSLFRYFSGLGIVVAPRGIEPLFQE
jgi:hypothetical protein